MTKKELVDVPCSIVAETEKAFLIKVLPIGALVEENIWVPKSKVELENPPGDLCVMPLWLAKEKDVV